MVLISRLMAGRGCWVLRRRRFKGRGAPDHISQFQKFSRCVKINISMPLYQQDEYSPKGAGIHRRPKNTITCHHRSSSRCQNPEVRIRILHSTFRPYESVISHPISNTPASSALRSCSMLLSSENVRLGKMLSEKMVMRERYR
jgi:hypothetical protein